MLLPRIRRGKVTLNGVQSWRAGFASAISDLLPSRRLVAFVLSQHMNAKGEHCFVSAATIAGESGYCVRTVFYALADLVERGWVEKDSRPGRTNVYRASVPSWWAQAATEQGHELVVGLEEDPGNAEEAASGSSSSPAVMRAHRWLENAGWQVTEQSARDELEEMVGPEAADALMLRWRELVDARAGPLAEAA